MSSYENYDDAAVSYAEIRQPIGLSALFGGISHHSEAPVEELDALDAGCGVGLYLRELAKAGIRSRGVDFSAQMLLQAETAIGSLPRHQRDRVSLIQADVCSLPIEDDQVDLVLASLVLHHVARDSSREGVRVAMAEFARVLRPGGLLVTVTCSPAQVRDGAWYCALVPDAVEILVERHGSLDEQESDARQAGFERIDRIVPVDDLLHGESYLDLDGPFDPSWRSSDSIFALAEGAELERGLEFLRSMRTDGSLDEWVSARESLRRDVGQATFTFYRA